MVRRASWRALVAGAAIGLGAVAAAACGSSATLPRPAIATVQPSAAPSLSAAAPAVGAVPAAATSTAVAASVTATAPATPVASASAVAESTLIPSASTPAATPISTQAPLEQLNAVALGGDTPVRSMPSMSDGETVATLADQQPIVIQREVRGQRWVVGDQTWAMATQDWSNLWYQVDGGYVYAGFVYIPRNGELDSLADTSAERWIDIDLTTQTARAMIGDRVVHTAPITSGKPGFETPAGQHAIEPWGRKFNETMTSAQAGIKDAQDQYNVHNVLYTQYFDTEGDALHLNYWQPEGVFGSQRTSHGCIGLQLHDAEYLWLFARPGMRVVIRPLPPAATPAPTAAPAATSAPAAATTAPARTIVPSTPTAPATPPAATPTATP